MASKYQEQQREKAKDLINNCNPVFYGSKSGRKFMGKPRDFVLMENGKNLYEPIRADVNDYFEQNSISWWGGSNPSGHVLSSQIACLNHLFKIRNDKAAVLRILKNVSVDFIDVLPIHSDKFKPGFIQFEAVIPENENYLNEGVVSRGSNCTSIDSLIYAIHKDNSKWLIPIEWKYTEHYNNLNKAADGDHGKERQKRYTELINNSKQLKNSNHSCYYYEPFYQLMRQTLWAEQMIINKDKGPVIADHFLHLHVIPMENEDLLEKTYICSGKNMELTWREHLQDQTKYNIISPKNLLSGINNETYGDLISYLTARYW